MNTILILLRFDQFFLGLFLAKLLLLLKPFLCAKLFFFLPNNFMSLLFSPSSSSLSGPSTDLPYLPSLLFISSAANLVASTTESVKIKAALLSKPGYSSSFLSINYSIFWNVSTSYWVTIVIALPVLPARAVLPTL